MASARQFATLKGALEAYERRLERYTANGKPAPSDLWRRIDTIKTAINLGQQGKSDREVKAYLASQGVEAL